MAERVLVTGAGGFIGHHMVKYLVARGDWVRGTDIKHLFAELGGEARVRVRACRSASGRGLPEGHPGREPGLSLGSRHGRDRLERA